MRTIFDAFLKDNYKYEITSAYLDEKEANLHVEVRLNFVVPFGGVVQARNMMKDQVPKLKAVYFQFIYEDWAQDERQRVEAYMDYWIARAHKECGVFAKTMEEQGHCFKDGEVILYVLGMQAEKILNEKLAIELNRDLRIRLGVDASLRFENHREQYAKTIQNVCADRLEAPTRGVSKIGTESRVPTHGVERAIKSSNDLSKRKKWPKEKNSLGPLTGNRIMGKPIKETSVPMDQVTQAGCKKVVQGEIFQIEERTIKSGKKLVTFLFSDETTSMCAKFFAAEDKWEQIKPELKKGVTVRAVGDVEWDSYTDSLVLMVKNIERAEKKSRTDDAPVKRVELHAHTKMSAMDGLNTPKSLVEQAIAWGHDAVAITDHGVVQAFPEAAAAAKEKIKVIYGMEGYLLDDEGCKNPDGSIDYKKNNTNHIIILAKDKEGLKNLYKLVSISHINYFYKRPRIPKSVLVEYRKGLILGSACEAGEVFRAVVRGDEPEKLREIAEFYDYLEIQPLGNNSFLVDKGVASGEEDLKKWNLQVLDLGRLIGKPVVATCDAHYNSPKDAIFRNILMAGQGYSDEGSGGLYLRTTDEMMDEFSSYMSYEMAEDIVVHNPRMIADQITEMMPVPRGNFPPKIEGADDILRDTCIKNAVAKYGSPIPEKIAKRLDKELNSIIGHGYAVMYVSAKMLVEKSMSDGFLVGSRGSVGSSFAATMSGITEVNPLAPHYICPQCKYLEWGDEMEYDCGVDMPEKTCPSCGHKLDQDGFSIPFETFLGFEGDKQPDIDLNFAGEYQATAHKYVDEIFGAKNVYKAGTIGTIASKTAYGFVKKYYDEKNRPVNNYEVERLSEGCSGVKRTTGQHPGGIIIVPDDHDIHEFCPVQRPANDMKSDIVTTHFDYHSIDENLLKLDILGHDVPSMIRQLQDMTGVDPQKVPLKDDKVNSIFNGIEGLDVKVSDYYFAHGSYGVPEFGTRFVRQMLDDTEPDKFADLVRISGFSHGTNVWINNAQYFIRSGEASMREAISTRDDIMNYLILKGLPNKAAFDIMEKVRKGKGVTPEQENLMLSRQVPHWYVESCKRISYMFPRAHAVAYVMMSYRIAYYKVYYPAEFYAVYLTTKLADFNWEIIKKGSNVVLDRIKEIELMGRKAEIKEQAELIVLEVVYEMFGRGYEFLEPSLYNSQAIRFTVEDGKVLVPLCGLPNVGGTLGKSIEAARCERAFSTIEDFQNRTKANKTAMESFRKQGIFADLPESDQISFF